MEEEEFSKLPISDKIIHKLWKARVAGYEELSKEFEKMDPDSQASEFRQYSNNLLQMAKDSNLVAQEAGLKCILSFVENAPESYRQREELVPIIIQKGLGSARQGTKTKSIEILLMLIEVDIGEPIIDLIIPELSNKQPKVVTGCVASLKEIVLQFGVRAVNIKAVLKSLGKMFGHSDKNVRAEASELVLAIYHWLNKAIDPFLAGLKPVQIKELNEKFDSLPKSKPKAPRLLRSQQETIQESAEEEEMEEGESEQEEEDDGVMIDLDPYEMAEAVDISSKIPGNFYTELASKKWKERKEILDELKPLVSAIKLSPRGPYSELVPALVGHINDTNVIVGILAVNCLESIARGLREEFSQFKSIIVPPLLEKLKEKKQTFVDALRGCLDATFASVSLPDVLDDILGVFGHKNPQVKVEAVRWLNRILQTIKAPPSRPETKRMCEELIKTYQDGDSGVREASGETLGTLMKCVGEKVVSLFTENLDSIKVAKVKDYFSRAQVQIKQAAPPKAAPSKPIAKKPTLLSGKKLPIKAQPPTDAGPEKKPVKKLLKPVAPAKGPSARPAAATATKKKVSGASAPAKKAASSGKPKEINITFKFKPEDVDDLIADAFPASILENLQSSAWKIRLEAMEGFLAHVETSSSNDIEPELLVRQLAKKPSFKEVNFQVMLKMFISIQTLCSNNPKFTFGCAVLCIPTLVDKLGDIKLRKSAGDCLEAFAERLSMRFVLEQCYPLINAIKSPKIQGDALVWVKQCINAFGITGVPMRPLIDFAIVPLGSSNATVRSNAVKLLGELRVYVGPEIKKFVQDLNPNLLSTIEAEFAKVGDQRPPTPTKFEAGAKKASRKEEAVEEEVVEEVEEEEEEEEEEVVESEDDDAMMDELFPRADISPQINSQLLALLSDGSWKMRKEGLDSIAQILEHSNKRIKPSLGELLPALKGRLEDVNKNLVTSALDICGNIATAVGKPFDKVGQPIIAPVSGCLNDLKATVRAAAIKALSCMADATDFSFMIKPIATSLTPESLNLRKELLAWLCERLIKLKSKLPDISPLVNPLMMCMHDKNSDARKSAQACLVIAIESLGTAAVKEKCLGLKTSLQSPVMQVIESVKTGPKVSSAVPSKKVASQPLKKVDSSSSKPLASAARKPALATKAQASKAPAPSASKPIIMTNDPNLKQSRLSKEKANRWTFETPPIEYIDALSELCQPHLSSDLKKLLFSTDTYREKDFIAGLSLLDKGLTDPSFSVKEYGLDLSSFSERCCSVSDLLFKYVTLKLHEQGTTILIKCLDLLARLFQAFEERDLQLHEAEAFILVPTLSHRLGHNNETLKKKVKDLVKQLCRIFPPSKVYQLLAENGLKSKNSKARIETLDEMSSLIQKHGVAVCTSPAKAFPVLAIHIGDRDAGVRSSAITAITQGYILLGEEVYKYLKDIPEKSRGYLEERFKRTKTKVIPPPLKPKPLPEDPNAPIFSFQKNGATPIATSPSLSQSNIPSPITKSKTPDQMPDSYERKPVKHIPRKVETPISRPVSTSPRFRYGDDSGSAIDDAVDRVLNSLVSKNLGVVIQGLEEVEKLFSGPIDLARPYTNDILVLVTQRLDRLFEDSQIQAPLFVPCLKQLLMVLTHIFSNPVIVQNITPDNLSRTIEEVLHRLLDQNSDPIRQSFNLSRQLNVLMVKILENTSTNIAYQTLIRLIEESVVDSGIQASDIQVKYTSYLIKCVWRLTRSIQYHLQRCDLDPSQLLFSVNSFFLKYSPSDLKLRKDREDGQADLLLKTFKTILYELCIAMGDDVLKHTGKLPGKPNHNCVIRYITVMLTRIKQKDEILGERSKPVPVSTEETPDPNLAEAITNRLHSILSNFNHRTIPYRHLEALMQFLHRYPRFRTAYQEMLEKQDLALYVKVNTALEDLEYESRKLTLTADINSPRPILDEGTISPNLQKVSPPHLLQAIRGELVSDEDLFTTDLADSHVNVEQEVPVSPTMVNSSNQRLRTVRDLRARLSELRLNNVRPIPDIQPGLN